MSDLTVNSLFASAHQGAKRGSFDTSHSLYAQARSRGWRDRIRSTLTRGNQGLVDLASVEASSAVQARHHAGLRTVTIDEIRGSEGRSKDFDRSFRPRADHNRTRWLSIASARQRGTPLPPVSLIQIGDTYFVRDGHHRISVARAMGQVEIEAEVVVWEMEGPLDGARAN